MSSDNLDPVYPEADTHDERTCPQCGGDQASVSIYDVPMSDEDYKSDVDQSETYYTCASCDKTWRYVGAD